MRRFADSILATGPRQVVLATDWAKSIANPCWMVAYALLGIFLPFWVIGSLAKTYWRCLAKTERERSA